MCLSLFCYLLHQASGIASIDVKKLKDAGLCTVESVAYSPRKELLQIKGISEAKVDKIIEAGLSFLPTVLKPYCFVILGKVIMFWLFNVIDSLQTGAFGFHQC